MLLVDTEDKKIIQDVEFKMQIARSRPHSEWLQDKVIIFSSFLLRIKGFRVIILTDLRAFSKEINLPPLSIILH